MSPHSAESVSGSNLLKKTARRCWSAFTRKSGQEFPYAPQLSLRVVLGSDISLRDLSLRAWEVLGIVEWGDLFEDHKVVPFDNLVNDFGVSPGTFMSYAAMMRQAAVRWDTLPREPDTSILLQTVLTHRGERKAITNIYKALHMEARCPLTTLRAYWEDALRVKLTDTQSEQALMVPKMISVNAPYSRVGPLHDSPDLTELLEGVESLLGPQPAVESDG
ncbi:hypothetical protein NDU88_003360 [Pleurodeles waltl]|uniref:Uncharacterized protein n=1 Tax=Pleurodeles waltl TaxID=8319 RepID=A0AAV7KYA3_PLEWA|nr:hypothetical protein NDU88_003360 [Pleurodeles waltl]